MKKLNWYKIAVFATIAIVIFLLGRKCGDGGSPVQPGVEVVDTVYLDTTTEVAYIPVPVKVVEPEVVYKTDTLETFEVVQVDTSQVLIDYHRRRYYRDTVSIEYGTAIISDTITANRIAGRSVKTHLQIPVITSTVTVYQPPRNIVYLGFSATGSTQNYFYSIGADLSLKVKNDRIYSAGVNLTRDNQLLYQAGVKFPIRLRGKIYDRR